MRQKLLAAAEAAAREATATERGRSLWCIDQVMIELRAKLDRKLLSEAQQHSIKVKLQIAGGLCMEFRRAIISGARPGPQPAQPALPVEQKEPVTGQEPGAAGFPSEKPCP